MPLTSGERFQSHNDSADPFWCVPGRSRLVWHPAVHEEYGEKCHYFLIEGESGDGRNVIDYLEDFLDQSRLSRGTLHAVFGPYDVLARLWLDREDRQNLLRQLKRSRNQAKIHSIDEFAAEEHDYIWNASALKSITISDTDKATIDSVARDAKLGLLTTETPAIKQLQNIGALLNYAPPEGEKIYVFLRARDSRISQTADIVTAVLAQAARDAGMDGIAITRGIGFCDYIVKGVVDSYTSCLAASQVIQESAARVRLHGWSLVVADYAWRPQGEELGTPSKNFAGELLEALSSVDVGESRKSEFLAKLKMELNSLPSDQLDALNSIYAHYRNAMQPKELERLTEIIAFTVTADRKETNKSLSFLTSIESDLRWLLPIIASNTLGDEWVHTITSDDWCSKQLVGQKHKFEDDAYLRSKGKLDNAQFGPKWYLGDFVELLRALILRYPDSMISVSERLSGLSIDSLTETVALRNGFAHGTLIEESLLRDYAGQWGENLHKIARSIAFQLAIESLREEISGQIVI